MRTYAVREGFIPAKVHATFEQMRREIEALPDLDPSERISCHVLARALAAVHPDCIAVDGHFVSRGSYHAWIDMGNGIVADVYPIGGAGPLLIDTSGYLNPWNRLYLPDPEVARKLDIEGDVAELIRLISDGRTTPKEESAPC